MKSFNWSVLGLTALILSLGLFSTVSNAGLTSAQKRACREQFRSDRRACMQRVCSTSEAGDDDVDDDDDVEQSFETRLTKPNRANLKSCIAIAKAKKKDCLHGDNAQCIADCDSARDVDVLTCQQNFNPLDCGGNVFCIPDIQAQQDACIASVNNVHAACIASCGP